MEYLSAHPAILTVLVIFAVVIILYFIFKQFIKLALVMLIIVIAAACYYYFQDPHKMSEKVVEKSKSFYKDSKALIDKTKEMPGDINKLFKSAEDKAGK